MVKPIKTEKQYKNALERIYNLIQKNLKPGSTESDELEVLSILVENYENKNYSIAPPHPIDAVMFRLEQLNIKTSELSKYLGYKSRVSEILSGKRKFSLRMLKNLHQKLGVPASSLLSD
ncbi:MAG: helix-turn-helix domain-containing protein [FCB group bacterium]|jgi:HTH-type transcriptional regulator/antitoxin HigA